MSRVAAEWARTSGTKGKTTRHVDGAPKREIKFFIIRNKSRTNNWFRSQVKAGEKTKAEIDYNEKLGPRRGMRLCGNT